MTNPVGRVPADEPRGGPGSGRRWRYAFWGFAALLFSATHWPRASLSGSPIPSTDKFLHVAVFATWTVLLVLSGYVGDRSTRRAWLIAGLVAAAYAAFDESTQRIAFLHRHASMGDYLANIGGIAVGVAGGVVCSGLFGAKTKATAAHNEPI